MARIAGLGLLLLVGLIIPSFVLEVGTSTARTLIVPVAIAYFVALAFAAVGTKGD